MKIDEFDFEYTAQAVYIMNPSSAEQYDSWGDHKSFMVMMAYQYGHNTNSFSTSGFQLTFFQGHVGEINCRASVSAYVAMKYLEKQLETA